MTSIEFKNKTYKLKKLTVGESIRFLERGKNISPTDALENAKLIIDGVLINLDITQEELYALEWEDVMDLYTKIQEAKEIPLQPKEKSVVQSSVITPPLS